MTYYRTEHRARASVVLLFNHESSLRPPDFFIPRLARSVASAISSRREGVAPTVTNFRSLDFCCDWGSAQEYADIIVDVLARTPSEDFVLATGHCLHARDLATKLFAQHGLELRDHVREDAPTPEAGAAPYHVDLEKLRGLIGRVPERTIESVVDEMIVGG